MSDLSDRYYKALKNIKDLTPYIELANRVDELSKQGRINNIRREIVVAVADLHPTQPTVPVGDEEQFITAILNIKCSRGGFLQDYLDQDDEDNIRQLFRAQQQSYNEALERQFKAGQRDMYAKVLNNLPEEDFELLVQKLDDAELTRQQEGKV